MPNNNLSPLSVVPYSKDHIVEFVRYKTGWDQRSEVSAKGQLNYLCKYLEVNHIDAKTIIIEDDYVDRHYMEDFAEYYARCFPTHPRKCSRLHFFSKQFDEKAFVQALLHNNTEFLTSLDGTYIGFTVVRPIPHTFLGRLCIKPYRELSENKKDYRIITRENHASLFGLTFNFNTTPFIEQDKVVSVCATSAIWTLLSASPQISHDILPSPSAITKIASHGDLDANRTFPTRGLTLLQVAKTLKHFGLEPSMLDCNKEGSGFPELKEIIFSYTNNNIPVLIGGSVYEETTKGEKAKLLGTHLVCALGYHIQRIAPKQGYKLNLQSHRIDKIYVHDDRYGPFLRLNGNSDEFVDVNGETKFGLTLNLHNEVSAGRKEYFVPDVAIVGLYHKVRITYADIKNTCTALHTYLHASLDLFETYLQSADAESDLRQERERTEFFKSIAPAIARMINCSWELSLIENTALKKDILTDNHFYTYNGADDKRAMLIQNMPRYIWQCRMVDLRTSDSTAPYTTVLFDATEVPQGRVVFGYVSYCKEAESVWQYVQQAVKNRTWETYESNRRSVRYISPFLRFFSDNKEGTFLNSAYGPLRLPRRILKTLEKDELDNINLRQDAFIIRRGGGEFDWTRLDRKKDYIWVIGELGDVVMGEDHDHGMGHPTLVDGRPARLGGELRYSAGTGKWLLNLKSGAYSSHLTMGSPEHRGYLSNVLKHNFIGASVTAPELAPS